MDDFGVEMRETRVGTGVFATRAIPAKALIGEVGGVLHDHDDGSGYCMDFTESHTLEPSAPFRYMNHSCQPNAELIVLEGDTDDEADMTVFAIRDIQVGEEITIDYGWPAEQAIPCMCLADLCRGWIVCEEEVEMIPPSIADLTTSPEIPCPEVARPEPRGIEESPLSEGA